MKTITLAAWLGLVLPMHIASAQYAGALRTWTPVPSRADSLRALPSRTRADSVDGEPHKVWPIYTVAGAVIGGAIIAGMALKGCDQNCQDDGGLAFAPPYLAAGAIAGGLVGLGLGLIIDSARGNVSLRVSMAAP